MSIDISQHWAAGGTTTARHSPERAPGRIPERAGAERNRPGSEPQIQPAPTGQAGPGNAATADASFGFGDFLDIINPLHHLPVVGTIYRDISGDEIKPVSRVLGAGVFGGPVGLAGGVAAAMIEETTGNDPMGHIYSAVTGRGAGADPDANRIDAREPRHWAAASGTGVSADAPGITVDTADQSRAVADHWAGNHSLGSNEPGAAGQGTSAAEQLAAVQGQSGAAARDETGDETGRESRPESGSIRETVTFFPLGRSDTGPRTVTIDRPSRQSPSTGGASADEPDTQAPRPAPAAAGSSSQGGDGRIDYRTEAVMRAMALGLGPGGSGPDSPIGNNVTSDRQAAGERSSADALPNRAPETSPEASPEALSETPAPAAADRWAAGPGGEDIAAAMQRALDRYEAQSGT